MLRVRKFMRANGLAVLLLCCAVSSSPAAPAPQSPQRELWFHSNVPLGAEGFLLKPGNHVFYLFATAQNAWFEGMHQARVAEREVLLDGQGRQVDYYPGTLNFRVTATTWPDKLIDVALFPINADADTNAYLLRLHFRLLIFRGLNVRKIEPANVDLIGMPADVPYNERIYGLTFDLGQVPIGDRMVLEVLSPEGERLCKFHLELL